MGLRAAKCSHVEGWAGQGNFQGRIIQFRISSGH
jgi:hypothetical protein